jgi:hypothetical protein
LSEQRERTAKGDGQEKKSALRKSIHGIASNGARILTPLS